MGHWRQHRHRGDRMRWAGMVPLWRSRARMQRRLFVWFGVSILVTSLVVSGTTAVAERVFGAGSGSQWGGVPTLVAEQAAHVWEREDERAAWAGSIAKNLGWAVRLEDADGTVLGTWGPPVRAWAASTPVRRDGERIGTVRLQPWNGSHRNGWMGLLALTVALATLWALSGGIAWKLSWPLVELTRVAQDLGDGKLHSRFDVRHARGEVRELAGVMNSMAERIERQLGDQRELLAAVSHELRTPLARIRLLLELGRGGDASVFEKLEQEVLEMDALVGELLASARLDFAAMARVPLEGADLGRRALERAGMSPLLLRTRTGPLALEGDPTLLQRALANLLENARVHAGGPSALEVSRTSDGRIAFAVEDAGPGLPPDDGGRFQPFRRGETSDGLGLGLALVRRIAEAHGGAAFAEPGPGARGARVGFTVRAAAGGSRA